jgi:hypothetical protein
LCDPPNHPHSKSSTTDNPKFKNPNATYGE